MFLSRLKVGFIKKICISQNEMTTLKCAEYHENLNNNIRYFEENKELKLVDVLKDLEVNIVKCNNRADFIREFASLYDYADVEHNGYRTCVELLECAVVKINQNLISLTKERSGWFFKLKNFIR